MNRTSFLYRTFLTSLCIISCILALGACKPAKNEKETSESNVLKDYVKKPLDSAESLAETEEKRINEMHKQLDFDE